MAVKTAVDWATLRATVVQQVIGGDSKQQWTWRQHGQYLEFIN